MFLRALSVKLNFIQPQSQIPFCLVRKRTIVSTINLFEPAQSVFMVYLLLSSPGVWGEQTVS